MNHLKFTFSILVGLTLLTGGIHFTFAETIPIATTTPEASSTSTTTEEIKAPPVVQNHPRVALKADFQTRLTNLAANVSNRLDALARRIDNVTTRLASRAGKLEASGMNVGGAAAKIDTAKTELAAAKVDLETIDDAVTRFVGSTDPFTSWQTVKTQYMNIQSHLKAAHKANVEALLILQSATATPTPETSSTTASTTNSN